MHEGSDCGDGCGSGVEEGEKCALPLCGGGRGESGLRCGWVRRERRCSWRRVVSLRVSWDLNRLEQSVDVRRRGRLSW